MGLLRFLAVPLRRVTHDSDLANAIGAAATHPADFWSWLSHHAFGTLAIFNIYLVALVLTSILVIAALGFVIYPLKPIKKWQKIKMGGSEGRAKFMRFTMIILAIILAVMGDAIWSNVAAFSLFSIGEKALDVIDTVGHQRGILLKNAAESQRFLSGITATARASGEDLLPILNTVDSLLSTTDELMFYTSSQAESLDSKVKQANLDKNSKDNMDNILKSLYEPEFVQKMKDLRRNLQKIQGVEILSDSSKEEGQGMMAILRIIPPLDGARPGISLAGTFIQGLELGRFLLVFGVLVLFIGTVAAGIQFYRLKRFRVVAICMLLVCIVLCGLELLALIHLVMGTLLGAFCDGLMGEGGQVAISIHGKQVSTSHLHRITDSCAGGADIAGAILGAYGDPEKLVNLTDAFTIDAQHKEVSIKAGDVVLSIPVKEGRGDLKKALELLSEKEVSGEQLQRYGQAISSQMVEAAAKFKLEDNEKLINDLKGLRVMLGTVEVGSPVGPIMQLLQDMKIRATKMVDATLTFLTQFQQQLPKLSGAVDAFSTYVNISSASTISEAVRNNLRTNMNPFIVESLQPAFECKEPGVVIHTLMDSLCSAGIAVQSLFLALSILIFLAVIVIVMLFVCRKFSEEHERGTNP